MSDETPLIRLYYETYGMSVQAIAEMLDASVVVVEMAVKTYKMTQGSNSTDIAVIDPSGKVDTVQEVKDLEVAKQKLFAPMQARLEYAILTKTVEVVNELSSDRLDASKILKEAAQVLQSLGYNSVSNQLVRDNSAPNAGVGFTVQILNSVQV